MFNEPTEQEIIDGWARVAESFELRPLTALESAQFERMILEDEISKRTPFILGEPIHG